MSQMNLCVSPYLLITNLRSEAMDYLNFIKQHLQDSGTLQEEHSNRVEGLSRMNIMNCISLTQIIISDAGAGGLSRDIRRCLYRWHGFIHTNYDVLIIIPF
ncbi:hypothetical protein ACJX0J_020021 [Zea mays]